jgi:hypothetical protein
MFAGGLQQLRVFQFRAAGEPLLYQRLNLGSTAFGVRQCALGLIERIRIEPLLSGLLGANPAGQPFLFELGSLPGGERLRAGSRHRQPPDRAGHRRRDLGILQSDQHLAGTYP